MEYEGKICTPPMERASFKLPIMTGCSYNKCKFCALFRNIKYRELPLEKIEEELLRIKSIKGNPAKIFLGDGNAFGLKTDRLLKILNLIHKYFPDCNCINTDATVTSILQKTDTELKKLYSEGIRCLYIGIESGLDDVLKFMNKDHGTDEAEAVAERINKAGYTFGAHIMTGIAGGGRSIENAEATAAFLNKTKPIRIINFSMFLHNEVPLYKDIKNGNYKASDELSNLKEEKRLLEVLCNKENYSVFYDGFHDFLEFRVRGFLPENKNKMIELVQNKIIEYENKETEYAFVRGECSAALEKDNGSGKVWNPAAEIA